MARPAARSEDVLLQATALVERVELFSPAAIQPLVVGFRHDGAISFFLSDELVYQFNAAGELRRAYVDGALFKAERRRLVRLVREGRIIPQGAISTPPVTQLTRLELTDDASVHFMQVMQVRLGEIQRGLDDGSIRAGRSVPPDAPVERRVQQWLQTTVKPIPIARRPNA